MTVLVVALTVAVALLAPVSCRLDNNTIPYSVDTSISLACHRIAGFFTLIIPLHQTVRQFPVQSLTCL